MMFARQSLCLFQDVYAFGGQRPRHRLRGITALVTDELLGAAILSPLFECDCRAPLHHQVFASDATTTRGAAVIAEPSCVELSWLWARTPRRGAYARLFLDGGVDSVLDKSDVRDELLYDVVRQLQPELRGSHGDCEQHADEPR